MTLDVTVLYVDGCPSWGTVLERVHAAAEPTDIAVRVTTQTIETEQDVDQWQFSGSATILIGGRPGRIAHGGPARRGPAPGRRVSRQAGSAAAPAAAGRPHPMRPGASS